MRYMNVPCSYCGRLFVEEDDVVTCPQCASPHHRDCWLEKGSCANADRHAEGFVWKFVADEPTAQTPVERVAEQLQQNQPETVECPFCGARNYANELYCTVCHEPIHQNASADAGEPLQDEEQREKMYADFRTYGGLDPQSNVGEISVREYSAYLGEKSGSYIRRFMTMHIRERIVSWNWAAFWTSAVYMLLSIALGPVWFFYRKMYKCGAVYMAILIALGIGSAVVSAVDPAYWEYTERTGELFASYMQSAMQAGVDPSQLVNDMWINIESATEAYWQNCSKLTYMWSNFSNLLYTFFLPLLAGFLGSGLYYKKAQRDILAIRAQHSESPDYLQMLKKKGGVCMAAAVGAGVGCIVISLLQNYLPQIVRSIGLV